MNSSRVSSDINKFSAISHASDFGHNPGCYNALCCWITEWPPLLSDALPMKSPHMSHNGKDSQWIGNLRATPNAVHCTRTAVECSIKAGYNLACSQISAGIKWISQDIKEKMEDAEWK